MAITDAQLAEIRGIVGASSPPTDSDLREAWDRLQSVSAVALEVQRARLATLRLQPANLTIEGDRTEGWGPNIQSLERHVAELQRDVSIETHPSTGTVTVGLLTRKGRSR